jgi:iron complex outermembrane receptor protein
MQMSCISCSRPPRSWLGLFWAVLAAALPLPAAAAASQPAPTLTAPEVQEQVLATYPADARAAARQARVVVLATVDKTGRVTAVELSESAGEPFDSAALAAARRWRFAPARSDGQVIESQVQIPFLFQPPRSEPMPPVPVVPGNEKPADGSAAAVRALPGGAKAAGQVDDRPIEKGPAGQSPADKSPADVPAADGPLAETGTAKGTFSTTVTGKRLPPPSRGAADFHVEIGALSAVPRKNASEALKLVPGILLTNDGSEAHADQVFLRGFDAREGQDIEFSVGGVPINESGNLHGNGYSDTHFILPELISALRVIEGPFDPRQGNYAVAGSADYELGLTQRGLTAKFSAGQFGTFRGLLLWGPQGGREGTFAAAELYETAGFGQNRDGRRATVMAQYEGRSGNHLVRLTAQAYIASFHSAGVVREDDYRSGRVGFFDTYDAKQGADTGRYSVSGLLESRFGSFLLRNQVFAIARPMRLRENFTGFLLDPQEPTQNPHGQRGDLIDLESLAGTLGARGFGRLSGDLFGQTQEIEVGYFARGDLAQNSQQRLEAATGNPYHVETDLESRLGNIGMYVDLNLRPHRYVALRGGLRGDLFTYDVLDKCAVQSVAHPSRENPPGDASCLSQQDFGKYREPTQRSTTTGSALLPRVTLVLGPLWGISAAVSYGQGLRSIDPVYITQDAKTPFASAQSVDAGLSFGRRLGPIELSLRSAFFQTRVDRDLIFSQTAGRNLLSTGTTRIGSASAVRALGRFFDVAANLTYVRATFDDTGLLIPYVPDWVVRFDGSLFGELPWAKLRIRGRAIRGTLASGFTYVSPRPLPQGERSNPIAILDLQATVGIWLFDLGLTATNLFDAQYRLGEYNYASDFGSQPFPTLVPMRHFSAGAPRQMMFSLSVNLGGGK